MFCIFALLFQKSANSSFEAAALDKSDSVRQLSSNIQSKLLCGNYYLWRIFENYDLSDIDIVGRNMRRLHMQAKQIPKAYRHGRFRRHMPDALLYGSENRGG